MCAVPLGIAMRRLTIFIYHRVLLAPDPLFPETRDAAGFSEQVRTASRLFTILPLGEAMERMRQGSLPRFAAAITFDDGYADNAEVALPVLKGLGLQATFFVSTGFLNGGCMWNDRVIEAVRGAGGDTMDLSPFGLGRHAIATDGMRRAAIEALIDQLKYLPMDERAVRVEALAQALDAPRPSLMMTDAQVRTLRGAGMEVGGHTVNHPILAVLDPARARREIEDGKAALEGILGERVRLFAYPNGRPHRDYSAEHVAMVRKAGFDLAVSTATGVACAQSDPLQLPRFAPWPRKPWRLAVEMVRNLGRSRCEVA
jgi:peptidoglycan/xylan/chitin deacetylase (PgdA/CDA1 family)